MHNRSIAEMQTGEGKTLTATLPMYLSALEGKGAHLATVNDYLAARDAQWMEPIYKALGLKVGIIQTQMSQPEAPPALRMRRDLRYGQGVRLRLLARPPLVATATRRSGRLPRRHAGSNGAPGGGGGEKRFSGVITSCSSTRPTASSSTKPARR